MASDTFRHTKQFNKVDKKREENGQLLDIFNCIDPKHIRKFDFFYLIFEVLCFFLPLVVSQKGWCVRFCRT